MKLTARAPKQTDFDEFYGSLFYFDEDNQALWAQVRHEWNVFQRNEATRSLVIEDQERPQGKRLVGFVQAVFVSDCFVQLAKSGEYPEANRLASQQLPDKSWPLLGPTEIGEANRGSGLNALVTRWGRATALLGDADLQSIQRFGCQAFLPLTRGYQFKEILMEAIGDDACLRGQYAGFQVRCDYAKCARNIPAKWTEANRPYLMGVTAAEAAARETSLISQFFLYSPPRLNLKADHCRLLRAALQGTDEEGLAAVIDRTTATVKKWWSEIYNLVDAVDPTLLSSQEEAVETWEKGKAGKRGKEKRGKLLQYLRDHPEELGPG